MSKKLLLTFGLAVALALPGQAAETNRQTSGRVVDTEGRPIAGARVVVTSLLDERLGLQQRLAGKLEGPIVVEVRTSPEGRFSLPSSESGIWRLNVSAPGKATMTRRLSGFEGNLEQPELTMVDASELELQVVDSEGRPVAEAAALVIPRRPANAAWWPRFVGGLSDSLGLLKLQIPTGEKLHVEVSATGLGVRHLDYSEGKSLRVEFPLAGHRQVEVRDSRGRPAAGVVAVQPRSLVPLGITDRAGRLTVSGLGGKSLQVYFWAADDQAAEAKIAFPEPPTGDQKPAVPPLLKVRLEPPLHLSGVVSSKTPEGTVRPAEPISGATVRDAYGRWIQADARGAFTHRLPALGEQVWLEGSAVDHLTGSQRWARVSLAREPEARLQLERAARLGGRVVDQHGKAVAAVALRAGRRPSATSRFNPRGNRGQFSWTSRSDERGFFTFDRLPANVLLSLQAEREGYSRLRQDIDPLTPSESRTDLRLELLAGRVGRGRIVDIEDQPLAGAIVRLFDEVSDQPMLRFYQASGRQQTWLAEAVTDADGLYQLDDLGPGRFSLQASATGFPAVLVPGLEITPVEGLVELGTLALVRGVALGGVVVDSADQPLADAQVQLVPSGGGAYRWKSPDLELQKATGPSGEFEFSSVAPGQQRLWVNKEGYLRSDVGELQVPLAEPLRIVLQEGLELPVRVVDPAGDPIAGAWVYSEGRSGFGAGGSGTDEEGRLVLRGLAPGSHRLRTHAEGYRPVSLLLELPRPSEAESEVTLQLEAGASLSGTVRYRDGQPAADLAVLLKPREVSAAVPQASGTTNAQGRFEIDGVEVGKYWLSAGLFGDPKGGREIEIRPGSNQVDLEIPAGVTLSGRVEGPAGQPLPGARVSLRGERYFGGQNHALVDSGGGFSIDRVPAGRYWIDTAHPDYAESTSEELVEVGDTPVRGLLVRLDSGTTLRGWLRGLELDELTGVEIYISSQSFNRVARPDFEGRFVFSNLSPDSYGVIAMQRGGRQLASGMVVIKRGQAEAEVELRPLEGVALRGVVLRRGEPASQVTVSIQISNPEPGHRSTRTNSSGQFTLEPVPEGSHLLRVHTNGNDVHLQQVTVVEGQQEVIIELPTGRLAGQVVDAATGDPVGEASLRLEPEEPSEGISEAAMQRLIRGSQQRTDSQGHFLLTGLTPKTYRLVVQRPGYATEQVQVQVTPEGGAQVEIRLTPSVAAVVQLTVDQGALPSSLQVVIFDANGRMVGQGSHTVGGDGRVEFGSLGAGTWQLVMMAEGRSWTQVALTVPGPAGPVLLGTGSQLEVEIPELAEDAGLTSLQLTDSAGQPLGGPAAPLFSHSLRLRAGRAEVPGLSAGTWQVVAEHVDGRRWQGAVQVVAGQAASLTLP